MLPFVNQQEVRDEVLFTVDWLRQIQSKISMLGEQEPYTQMGHDFSSCPFHFFIELITTVHFNDLLY